MCNCPRQCRRLSYKNEISQAVFSIHAMESIKNLTHANITVDAFRVDLCSLQVVRRFTSNYQENRAVARKPRDAAAVLFGLMFADNIHYKFKSSQASNAMLQSSNHTGPKQTLTQNGHS